MDQPLAASHSWEPEPPNAQGALRWVQWAGDAISRICLWCAALAMSVVVAICGVNVIRRYLLGSVWSWAEEAMLFLMIVTVFLGAATVTWNGIHLTLDMLLNRLPARTRMLVVSVCTIMAVATLALCSVISFQVVKLMYDYNQKSQALELPLWMPQGMVCLGFGLMTVLTVMRFAIIARSRPVPPLP